MYFTGIYNVYAEFKDLDSTKTIETQMEEMEAGINVAYIYKIHKLTQVRVS